MKRVVIVCVLVVVMIYVSWYSIKRVGVAKDNIVGQAEIVRSAFLSGDKSALEKEAQTLASIWKKEETALAHYVHHDRIDLIGTGISRVPALIHGEQVRLFEELDAIIWLINHVWRSEFPSLDNIL